MAYILSAFLTTVVVCVVAFEDFIYVYGKSNKEMMEQGRAQYQVSKISFNQKIDKGNVNAV